MQQETITKYRNSFYIELNFDGDVKYMDSHGKVMEEPTKTSLIACYKSITKFVSKHRRVPFILFDNPKPETIAKINTNAYDILCTLTVLLEQEGTVPEEVRRYLVLKCKETIFDVEGVE